MSTHPTLHVEERKTVIVSHEITTTQLNPFRPGCTVLCNSPIHVRAGEIAEVKKSGRTINVAEARYTKRQPHGSAYPYLVAYRIVE